MDYRTLLKAKLASLPTPQSFFHGLSLPADFALPDNILMFFHSWNIHRPVAHGRYTLVIPFLSMCYQIDSARFALHPGQALLIYPHQLRFVEPGQSYYDRLLITFDLPSPQAYLPQTPLQQVQETIWPVLERCLDDYQDARVLELSFGLLEILRQLSQHPVGYQPVTMSQAVTQVLTYICQNLSKPLSIDGLAAHVHMSASNLRLIFRREIGMSLGKYILHQRLDSVRYLLMHTRQSVEEIARSCGFSNVSVFSHCFSRKVGMSPLQFRQQQKAKQS
ncbi:MAG: helix-turn-helix transcriptional regulator [Lentisphaeria bacterium]